MSVLPAPTPLEHPPGDPEAVLDLVADLTSAAARLDELAAEVGGARGRVPVWQGADADATAARADAVARVAARTGEGLRTAATRLAEHAECWRDVRRRVQAMRAQQEDDFAVARVRVATPMDPAGWTVDGPVSAVEELEAAERSRRAAHTALLADLEEDAAVTGRVLAGATAGIDGGAGSASPWRVLTHLAAELPGWALYGLIDAGRTVAETFTTAQSLGEWEEAASAALAFADDPRFAEALLASLGVEGMVMVFDTVDHVELGVDSATALLLATALGALGPGQTRGRLVAEARYVDPDADAGLPEEIARGMALVASAGATRGSGIGGPLLGSWAQQMLARERAQGLQGLLPDQLTTLSVDARDADPLLLVVEALAASGDAGVAVDVLGDRQNWIHLLERGWPDDGRALGDVVGLLADEPSPAAGATLRAGLEAMGTGLEDEGDPSGWTVDRAVAAGIAPSMGAALGAHVDVLTDLLAVGVDGRTTDDSIAALQGLAYLSIDGDATRAIQEGLDGWQARRPPVLEPVPDGSPLPSVAVPSAFLAVREYGQRLDHVLAAHALQEDAERRARVWDLTVGLVVDVAFSKVPLVGAIAGGFEALISRGLGTNGHWENGPDDGLRFDGEQAADGSVEALAPVDPEVAESVSRHAVDAFDRTRTALPELRLPVSEDPGAWAEVLEGIGIVDVRPKSGGGVRVLNLPLPQPDGE